MSYFSYYGTIEQYFDPAYSKRALVQTFGRELTMTDVTDRQQGVMYYPLGKIDAGER